MSVPWRCLESRAEPAMPLLGLLCRCWCNWDQRLWLRPQSLAILGRRTSVICRQTSGGGGANWQGIGRCTDRCRRKSRQGQTEGKAPCLQRATGIATSCCLNGTLVACEAPEEVVELRTEAPRKFKTQSGDPNTTDGVFHRSSPSLARREQLHLLALRDEWPNAAHQGRLL